MKKLSLQDQRFLDAAEGWLGLNNYLEAHEELEQIMPVYRAHPDVLKVRYEIYSMAKKWEACFEIADSLVTMLPDDEFGWVYRSFALHELKQTEQAYDQLMPVNDKFPDNWMIPYNLACYCSQLNRFEEAEDWFRKAMVLDEESVKQAAVEDPDLQPLWDSRNGTMWKRT